MGPLGPGWEVPLFLPITPSTTSLPSLWDVIGQIRSLGLGWAVSLFSWQRRSSGKRVWYLGPCPYSAADLPVTAATVY